VHSKKTSDAQSRILAAEDKQYELIVA